MAVPTIEVERRVASFSQALRESGLRLTHQRLEVAREIARTEVHPDTEMVYREVRTRVPTISLDTVYRTLAVLGAMGLVEQVDVSAGPRRFDANLEPHHHFVCRHCGLVRDVYDSGLDGLAAPNAAGGLGRVDSIRVQLRGVCWRCQKRDSEGDEKGEPR